MQKAKLLLLTAISTVAIFSVVLYSSCRNPCKNVVCLNGGACSQGNCLCQTGYVGPRCESLATTEIDYDNNTYTTVTITLNNTSTYTIAPGSSLAITGHYGDDVSFNASTAGSYGVVVTWNDISTFPASGALGVPLDIGINFFYLRIINNNNFQTISSVTTNYGTAAAFTDYPSLPPGSAYSLGYYAAYSNTEVYATSLSGASWSWFPNIPTNNDPTVTLNAY